MSHCFVRRTYLHVIQQPQTLLNVVGMTKVLRLCGQNCDAWSDWGCNPVLKVPARHHTIVASRFYTLNASAKHSQHNLSRPCADPLANPLQWWPTTHQVNLACRHEVSLFDRSISCVLVSLWNAKRRDSLYLILGSMSKATLPLIVEFLEILLRYLIGFLLDALWLPLFRLPHYLIVVLAT